MTTSYWRSDTFLSGVIKPRSLFTSVGIHREEPDSSSFRPHRCITQRSPRRDFFSRGAEVFFLIRLSSPLSQPLRILVTNPGRDPGYKGAMLFFISGREPRGHPTEWRPGDLEFHREKPRARAYVRESRQKATQEKGSSSPLSLSVFLSLSLGTRYTRCTCRCNPDSVKSSISWSPVASIVVVVVVVVVSSSSSTLA